MIVQLVQFAIAGAVGATVMYGSIHLLHWPFRPIQKWEDQMLRQEIAEADDHAELSDSPAAAGYAQGVHTAALMLGAVEPKYRQDRAVRRRTRA